MLGVAGEVQKLSDRERLFIFETVVEEARDLVLVFVDSSREGTGTTVEVCREAEARGAAGVMVAPQTFLGPGAALTEHYRRIGESGEVPVILQDFPPVDGVVMSPQQMPEFVEAVASIVSPESDTGLPSLPLYRRY